MTIGRATELVVLPTGKDIDQQRIVDLRRLFRNAGIEPDNPARNTHKLGRSADVSAQADGDLDRAIDIEDFSVDNDRRGITEVAREVLIRAGWL